MVSSFQLQVVFRDSSAGNSGECTSGKNRDESGRVEGVRHGSEETLKRPTARQMDADATSCLTDAGSDFEQLRAQSFDLRRT